MGNQQETFEIARTSDVHAPVDFAIVAGWEAIMRGIFPTAIDSDLVHPSRSLLALGFFRRATCVTDAKAITDVSR